MAKSARAIFLLVTSQPCDPCRHLKDNLWPTIQKQISEANIVDIVHVDLPTFNIGNKTLYDINESKVPEAIKYHIHAFPSMFLIPNAHWNQCLRDDKKRLSIEQKEIFIFNRSMMGINITIEYIRKCMREMQTVPVNNSRVTIRPPRINLFNGPRTQLNVTSRKPTSPDRSNDNISKHNMPVVNRYNNRTYGRIMPNKHSTGSSRKINYHQPLTTTKPDVSNINHVEIKVMPSLPKP